MNQQDAAINRLLVYVNQLDPLVPSNDPTLEVWKRSLQTTDMHAAKRVVIDYYGASEPGREPITPGYIRRQARRIETTYNREIVMCAEHDWNHATTCAECRSEIAAGDRRPDQQGQQIRRAIPPPDSIRQQLKQVLAAKDINN